jgi:hypothetical protein
MSFRSVKSPDAPKITIVVGKEFVGIAMKASLVVVLQSGLFYPVQNKCCKNWNK